MGRTRGWWVPVGVVALTGLLACPAGGAVKYKRERFRIDPGEETVPARAICPADTHVLSGGFGTVFGTVEVHESTPIDRGDRGAAPDDGWRVVLTNTGPAEESASVWAICATQKPRYRTREIFALGTAHFRVACPDGYRAVGAGGVTSEGAALRAWAPFDFFGEGARAARVMAGFGLTAAPGQAVAVCSDLDRLRYPQADFGVPGSGDVISPQEIQCPGGRRVLGGGAYPSQAFEETALVTLDSFPTDGTDPRARPDDVWLFTVADPEEGVTNIRGVAVCAPR